MGSGLDLLEVFQPPDGGAAEHVRLLALGLLGRGHRVTVAGPADAVSRRSLSRAGAEYVPLTLGGRLIAPGLDRASGRELRALVGERRFDLVHAHGQTAGILARPAARRARVPCVYTPHMFGYRSQLLRDRRGARVRYAVARGLEHWLGRHTAAIVAVAEDERRAAVRDRIVPPGRVHTILNGVEPDPAVPADPAVAAFRGDGPLFGVVSGLRPEKGVLALLDALEMLEARGELPRFAIVGNGPLEAEVARRIEGSERVRRFPFGGRMEPYLRALDVFVLASEWEGLPLAVLEAMTLGVPALATAVGGTPEAIREGETGWLVPPKDARALAERIADVASDPPRLARVAAAARADAAARFGAARMVDQTEALYRSVVGAAAR